VTAVRGAGPTRAVFFDVDFTLARPGPELGPQGYARIGARHGLTLDTERYEDARLAAIAEFVKRVVQSISASS